MKDIIPLQSVANDTMAKILNEREANAKKPKIKVGDKITFKAMTMYSSRKATRVVREIDSTGRPLVHFDYWTNFQVRWNEISHVNGVRV